MDLRITTPEELSGAAKELFSFAGNHRIFLFYGEMGAGKTTLIKALCKHLQAVDNVSSPTFSIVNEYESDAGAIYHFDFYRLKAESEALDLGYEDYFYSGNYCFIEWPEKIPNLLPDHYVRVDIKTEEAGSRRITASAY